MLGRFSRSSWATPARWSASLPQLADCHDQADPRPARRAAAEARDAMLTLLAELLHVRREAATPTTPGVSDPLLRRGPLRRGAAAVGQEIEAASSLVPRACRLDQALAIRRSRHTSTSLTETAVSNPGLGDEIGLDRAPEETSTPAGNRITSCCLTARKISSPRLTGNPTRTSPEAGEPGVSERAACNEHWPGCRDCPHELTG